MPEQQPEYLQFGGMAVIEGIMMRSPKFWSVACRTPNGHIIVKTEPLEQTWIGRQQWLKKPFLRGTLALLDTMALGHRAMRFASDLQMDERFMTAEEKQKAEEAAAKKGKKFEPKAAATTTAITIAILVSLAIGFMIFDVLPEAIAQFVKSKSGIHNTWVNAIAEVVKLVLFVGYLALIRRMPAILEVFKYHGAEHQAINTMEAKMPLTPENCLLQTRLHPRCGTNFAIMVIIIGFLVFIPIPRDLFLPHDAPHFLIVAVRMLVKIAVLPLVAGISYEIIRLAGKAKDQRWVNILLKPGLMTQYITTEPAELKHTEVAVAALEAVETAEKEGVLTNTDVNDPTLHVGFVPAPLKA